MKMPEYIPNNLFAPCGLNCMLCHHHCKSDEPCTGCREGKGKSKHCKDCEIQKCAENKGLLYCYSCSDFPCSKISEFNETYIRRFGHEFISNAIYMKEYGKKALTKKLRREWRCPSCNGIICIHDNSCSECGNIIRYNNTKKD